MYNLKDNILITSIKGSRLSMTSQHTWGYSTNFVSERPRLIKFKIKYHLEFYMYYNYFPNIAHNLHMYTMFL